MSDNPLCHEMGVVELATGFKNGSLPLEGFYDALRQYGDAVEPQVQAFAHQSPEVVDAQRWMLQELVSSGSHLPALFGVPIGVKDNIDTADYPTELGFEGAIGRTPSVDAYLIHRLREAGAVVWGKTRTAELAYLKPPTRQIHATLRTRRVGRPQGRPRRWLPVWCPQRSERRRMARLFVLPRFAGCTASSPPVG